MEIWIKQGNIKIRLPVLPANYDVTSTQNNTQVNVNNVGEVNLLGKRNLKTISFSTFFPKQRYEFCQTKPKAPMTYVKLIEKIKKQGIVRLVMTGVFSKDVTIESFTWGENDGTRDINYTLELKEYIKPVLKKKKKKQKVNKTTKKVEKAETKRTTKPVKTQIYIVKKGDTLAKIAKKLTGNSANYKAIANQNKIRTTSKLKVGQKLVIKI